MPTQVMEYEEMPVPPPSFDAGTRQESSSSVSTPIVFSPALTLSLGGVNFCLTPQTNDSSVTFLGMGSGTEAFLNLKSFTGNLRVCLASAPPPVVREESPPPERNFNNASPADTTDSALSAGQQKLNFTGSNSVKSQKGRNRNDAVRNKRNKSGQFKNNDCKISSATGRSDNDCNSTPTTANVSKSSNKQDMTKKGDSGIDPHPQPHISPLVVNKKRSISDDVAKVGSGTKKKRENYDSLTSQDLLSKASNQTSKIKDILNRMSQGESTFTNTKDEDESTLKYTQETTIESDGGHDNDLDDNDSTTENNHDNDNPDDPAGEGGIIHKSGFYVDEDDDDCSANLSTASSPEKSNIPLPPTRSIHPPPCPRWGHTMTLLNNDRVLVYGGQTLEDSTGDPKTLSDVHIFDKVKRQWYRSFNCEDATRQWPRQWHTATFLPERQLLICFGGESTNPKTKKTTTTAKVMVLDTEIMLWYPPTVSGTVPSGRSGHTATLLQNTNELVVFGGVRGSKWLNSVSILNTVSWVWSTPQILGSGPKPRSYHTATHVSFMVRETNVMMNRIVIFGGNDSEHSFKSVHVLETDGNTWRWINPTVCGQEPLPRTGHTATLLNDKKTICIYGGWDPNEEDDDEQQNCNSSNGGNNTKNAIVDSSRVSGLGNNDPGSDAMNNDNNNESKDNEEDDVIFNDCFLLDTETWTWRPGPKPKQADMIDSDCQGKNEDIRRVGHTAMLCNDVASGETSEGQQQQRILLFGGRVPNDCFAGDFKALDLLD